MPPAKIKGIFSLSKSNFLNTSKVSSKTRSNSKRASFSPATVAAPKWPAAWLGCSITIASGNLFFFIQRFNTILMPRDSDKIGNKATSGWSSTISGKSKGKPAPITMACAPDSQACFTNAGWSFTAFITLTAIMPRPSEFFSAVLISRSNAMRFNRSYFSSVGSILESANKSSCRWRKSTLAMVPTPFSRATALERLEAEMATPIPPCTMGISSRPRICSGLKSLCMCLCFRRYRY